MIDRSYVRVTPKLFAMTHVPDFTTYTRDIAGNPYGNSRVKFADGSTYEGEFDEDGRFSGKGRFRLWSPSGPVYEGVFVRGELLLQMVSTVFIRNGQHHQVTNDKCVHVRDEGGKVSCTIGST